MTQKNAALLTATENEIKVLREVIRTGRCLIILDVGFMRRIFIMIIIF